MELDATFAVDAKADIIKCQLQDGKEVMRIAPDGRIFWKQREVETDDEFRAAMLELKDALMRKW